MATFTVSAPEVGYAGAVGNVQFAGGQAVIDDERNPAELAYCRAAGYRVEAADEAQEPEQGDEPQRPAANAPKDAWLRYAVHLGATPEQVELTKAQLIEWVNEHEGEDQ